MSTTTNGVMCTIRSFTNFTTIISGWQFVHVLFRYVARLPACLSFQLLLTHYSIAFYTLSRHQQVHETETSIYWY